MPIFHIVKKKFKKFGICRNWVWCPGYGHYGFIWIFGKPLISAEGRKELRKWLDHLGNGPVFPED